MKAKTTQDRCGKCVWVHEADSKAKTSFLGVGLCPLHAAASDLLKVAKGIIADKELSDEHDPGGESGPGQELVAMASAAIAKAEVEEMRAVGDEGSPLAVLCHQCFAEKSSGVIVGREAFLSDGTYHLIASKTDDALESECGKTEVA